MRGPPPMPCPISPAKRALERLAEEVAYAREKIDFFTGGSLQLQLAQLFHIGAAGAEDVADIGAAGQVTHAEPQ